MAKVTKVLYRKAILINIGNYENVRFEVEAEATRDNAKETEAQMCKRARKVVNAELVRAVVGLRNDEFDEDAIDKHIAKLEASREIGKLRARYNLD